VADYRHDLIAYEFGRCVCRELGLALVVHDDELNLASVYAALGIEFLGYQGSRVNGRKAVRGEVAGMRAGDSDLDHPGVLLGARGTEHGHERYGREQ
jgi:hypothetical protein